MEQANWKSGSADALLAEFFAQDDLKALAADAGALLECPLIPAARLYRSAFSGCRQTGGDYL